MKLWYGVGSIGSHLTLMRGNFTRMVMPRHERRHKEDGETARVGPRWEEKNEWALCLSVCQLHIRQCQCQFMIQTLVSCFGRTKQLGLAWTILHNSVLLVRFYPRRFLFIPGLPYSRSGSGEMSETGGD